MEVVTIRYYEQNGILPRPRRTEGNYRAYTLEDVARLRFVRRCRDLGLSLAQIRDLLRLSAQSSESCHDVCDIAQRHLASVEEELADLDRLAVELRKLGLSCSGDRPMAECRIIEAISTAA